MKLALIQENIVVKVVEESSEEAIQRLQGEYQTVINITDFTPMPDVGWRYSPPQMLPPADYNPASIKITKLALRQRLTFPELCAFEAAALTDVQIMALKGNLTVATFVDLKRFDTVAAMGLCVAKGLLTQERANQILNTLPSPYEVYKE